MVVQVNGKKKGTLDVPAAIAQDEAKLEAFVKASVLAGDLPEQGAVKKVVVVKGKLVNFVEN